MKVLILGGRKFLGRHIVNSFLNSDCDLTLFNRGKTNTHLYTSIETIIGDRNFDLEKLNNRKWDVIIDTCGYDPKKVGKTAQILSNNVSHYIFISSGSVYKQTSDTKISDESAPITNVDVDYQNLDSMGKDYGACKYLSEKAITDNFNGIVTHIRPGLLVGPYDPTARFPYWIKRLSKGGLTLAPPRDYPTKFLDARDLADWCVYIAKYRLGGVFNTSGPKQERLKISEFLELANKVLGGHSKLDYRQENFFKKHNVQYWTELPLWVVKEAESFMLMDSSKAISQGLKFRSIEETVLDTSRWLKHENVELNDLKYKTLSSEKEKALLQL